MFTCNYLVVRRQYNVTTMTVEWFPLGHHATSDAALRHANCLVGMIGLRIVNSVGDSIYPHTTHPNAKPWTWYWQPGCRF